MPEYQYPHRFINQYARISRKVSDRLALGVVSYSRRGNFYSENRTRHYTRANMLRAVDMAEKKGYAVNTVGFKSARYTRGIASKLTATERLLRAFEPIRKLEVDVEQLPLLVVDGRPAFATGAIDTINSEGQWPQAGGALDLPTTYDATYRLNREYFNLMRVGYRNLRLEGDYLEVVGLTWDQGASACLKSFLY